MPKQVLVLFAHPALEKSRVNRRLVEAVRGLEGVTVHDLYEHYPDFYIDVPHEQRLLTQHEVIVLQHPMFWYSTPALVKQWEDLVLEHGWAYGSKGTALRGKQVMCAITAGGGEAAYQHGGFARFTIRELLAPIEQTWHLCGTDFLPPFVLYGTHRMSSDRVAAHVHDYVRTVEALRDGTLDLEAVRGFPVINVNLDAVICQAVQEG